MDESLFKKKSIIVSENPKLNNEKFRVSIEYFFFFWNPPLFFFSHHHRV